MLHSSDPLARCPPRFSHGKPPARTFPATHAHQRAWEALDREAQALYILIAAHVQNRELAEKIKEMVGSAISRIKQAVVES